MSSSKRIPNLYITSISKDAIYMVVRSESILLWAEQSTKKKIHTQETTHLEKNSFQQQPLDQINHRCQQVFQ